MAECKLCGARCRRHFCPGHDSRMLSRMLRRMYGRRPILGFIAAHPDVAEEVRQEARLA